MSYRDYIKDMDLWDLNNLSEIIEEKKAQIASESKMVVWRIFDRGGMCLGNYKQEDYEIASKALARWSLERYHEEISSGGPIDIRYLGLEIRGERTAISEYNKYDFDKQ